VDAAMMRGFDVEAFHCALDPSRIEHLVIPALDVAVINAVEPHFYQPHYGDFVIETMTCVNSVTDDARLVEKNTAREMYRRCMDEAVNFLSRAKKTHDDMETYYIPHMDFAHIEIRRQKVMARIIEFTKKSKYN
jgi:hypothetical protein